MTLDQFFSAERSLFSGLSQALTRLLQTSPEDVQVFSVAVAGPPEAKALHVWFAARGCKAEKLLGYVAAARLKVRNHLFYIWDL